MHKSLLIVILASLVSACSRDVTPVVTGGTLETTTDPADSAPSATPPREVELRDYPVVPVVSGRAREIFRAGEARGRNARVFTKVGDCVTDSPDYLIPFGTGDYDLGEYGYLQEIIDYYSAITVREVEGQAVNSFSNPSLAAASGFTSAGPLDPTWANPHWCLDGESPLTCEYRLSNPSLALIMFGTNDVQFVEAGKFEQYMRAIVEETMASGIVPVLSTFPPQPTALEQVEAYNRIIIRIAVDHDVPLVNLWLALQDTPGYGVDAEHVTSLTVPADGCAACFTEGHMEAGITVHNMITLMALNEIWHALFE